MAAEAPKGYLVGIARRSLPHGPMEELEAGHISIERGVEHDARGKPGRRQVTVLTREGWDAACHELDNDPFSWTSRRANLLVQGVPLKDKIGYDLQIGDAVLRITGETRPCKRMDECHRDLMKALEPDWRGGVTGSVLRSGDVRVGCDVVLRRNIARQYWFLAFHHARQLARRGRRMAGKLARRLGWKSQRPVAEHH